jgi:hypothetical protein
MHIFRMSSHRPSTDRRAAACSFAVAVLTLSLLVSGAQAQGAAQSTPQHDATLDARDAQGLTPLINAASAGQTEAIKSLLARGAGVDATGADGRTALIAAVQSGRMEVVEALIAAGANLNLGSRGTGTALNVAENSGQTQLAALLLKAGAHTTGKSVGDTVCVRPWGGDGYCGEVKSFSVRSVQIKVTRIVGCAGGCQAKEECSATRAVGGSGGVQAGDEIAVPSWCLTHTGVKP